MNSLTISLGKSARVPYVLFVELSSKEVTKNRQRKVDSFAIDKIRWLGEFIFDFYKYVLKKHHLNPIYITSVKNIIVSQYGFNMVMQHREVINYIAVSLTHKSLRTKALVLELLAAICLVKGGHELILSAFDNLKEICHEKYRYVITNK